jgi:hypothetical protein
MDMKMLRKITKISMRVLSLFLVICCLSCSMKSGAPVKHSEQVGWVSPFNGKDLAGWETLGGASWTVEDGCIVGRQGPHGEAGELLSTQQYGDFELEVTFKMRWPANSGVWFRYQSAEKAYQADILEFTDPVCYTGSLYCPGKMFLALNKDPGIVNRDGWNTLKVRAQGDHIVITLNDIVTADVHDDSSNAGRIGFQVHPGDEFKQMQITVRKVLIRSLR